MNVLLVEFLLSFSGYEMLSVNGIDLEGCTHSHALEIFKVSELTLRRALVYNIIDYETFSYSFIICEIFIFLTP